MMIMISGKLILSTVSQNIYKRKVIHTDRVCVCVCDSKICNHSL